MSVDSSTYIRKLQCCKSTPNVRGPQGPPGIQGPEGDPGPPGESFALSGQGEGSIMLYNISDPSYYYNDILTVSGNTIEVSGSIIPTTDSIFSLGSFNNRFKELFISPGSINIKSSTGGLDATLGSDSQGIAYSERGFATPFINVGPTIDVSSATGGWLISADGSANTSNYDLITIENDTSGGTIDPSYSLLRGGKLEKLNALLYYTDISINDGNTIYLLELDDNKTVNNGFKNFLDPSDNITFENIKDYNNLFITFSVSAHTDQIGNQINNDITFDLSSNLSSNLGLGGTNSIHIDSRTIHKDNAHLCYGPVTHKLLESPTEHQTECIDKNNHFRLRVNESHNKQVTISEITLRITGTYYS